MATALAIAGASTVGIEGFVPSALHASPRVQWTANRRWGQRTADPLDAIATPAALDRDQPLFREGESADNVFEVTSGTIRVFKLLPDGRRQIIGFLEAGDFLGLSFNENYLYTAEAVTPASVRRFSRRRLDALIDENQEVRRRLMAITANELLTAQDQMVLLGRKTAKEKLCTFLMNLSGEGGPARSERRQNHHADGQGRYRGLPGSDHRNRFPHHHLPEDRRSDPAPRQS
jgi:CRP/FNR family transcriptional regulator, anaerobic regulatory protein